MKINRSHRYFFAFASTGLGSISRLAIPTNGFSPSCVRPAWPTSTHRVRAMRTSTAIRDSLKSDCIDDDRAKRLDTLANLANEALASHGNDIFKPFHARVAVVMPPSTITSDDEKFQQSFRRLGLIATQPFSKADQTVAAIPFYDTDGSGLALAPSMATDVVYKHVLPEGYDGWTGDVGLLAMLLLNEMAKLHVDASTGDPSPKGVADLPHRQPTIQSLMTAYVAALPSYEEMTALHPLLWNERDQELLQSSSTQKIYRLLDDIDDDAAWLEEHLWKADRQTFPETISLRIPIPIPSDDDHDHEDGHDNDNDYRIEQRPCFSPRGFRYAVALVRSRSFFVDGSLRLLPFLDFANHDDDDDGFDSREISGGGIGTLWGSAKGAFLKSGKALSVGDEVKISYGPKGPAEYLLDHGFVPDMCRSSRPSVAAAITAELTFEVDDGDRFRDDKLDVLEYDTYESAPMEPRQSFDIVGGVGSTGEPDPAMMQFLRLVKLGGKDAFLLESIFRKEVWGFMSEPVSEENERQVVMEVIDACERALEDMEGVEEEEKEENEEEDGKITPPSQNARLCAMVRESERRALERTLAYMKQESEALDLKEYYQERRLKSLGLDSEWSPEDDDVGWGGTRVPGGANYDW
ncbi:hypothetical protein ACHAXS_001613 [Conticribra weissflogii]